VLKAPFASALTSRPAFPAFPARLARLAVPARLAREQAGQSPQTYARVLRGMVFLHD
jgi:hypothetical protein